MVKYYVNRSQEEIFKLLDCITDEKETLSSRISSTGSGLRELSKNDRGLQQRNPW